MNGQRFGALLGEAIEMSIHTHYGGQRSRFRAARAVSLYEYNSHISYYLSVPKSTKLPLLTILKHFVFPCACYYISFI